ncbi:UDP-N-acetylenolpyruvoylglucosamine reductase [Ornithobacterium rhinotracheale]|uniref:UDP-N-acetylenolpyruvoylglucosamine reductase n=1 Tax=Ornithobacterium rhinotracheale TaxID=28251 RepID=UPI00129C6C12|nr:UDP-N-acetylenolpyruvoylglucosamine reductase [Ornithobacterium rhinotracheale]MRI64291.1 UDP-N-acetylenolpyruvoylglucosamine reductase [Ornithobacterium rhinotracheale]
MKQVRDNRGRTYFRAIISDSKLSKTSPWTPNQKSELINVFRDNPNKKFIEFEVRTELEKLPIDSPIKTKDKVRVYKEEVYKIISDGNSNFGEVLDYKEIFK